MIVVEIGDSRLSQRSTQLDYVDKLDRLRHCVCQLRTSCRSSDVAIQVV